MRFIVDAQLLRGLCMWLQARGHQANHVTGMGMGSASDFAIAERAVADSAFIISKDQDFLVLRLPDRFGFIWLRVGNATSKSLFGWLDARWQQVDLLLAAGERFIEVR